MKPIDFAATIYLLVSFGLWSIAGIKPDPNTPLYYGNMLLDAIASVYIIFAVITHIKSHDNTNPNTDR